MPSERLARARALYFAGLAMIDVLLVSDPILLTAHLLVAHLNFWASELVVLACDVCSWPSNRCSYLELALWLGSSSGTWPEFLLYLQISCFAIVALG